MLLEFPNPKYRELQNAYVHLKDLQINEHDLKNELPFHLILGISDYTKIKKKATKSESSWGTDSWIELKFVWVIVSPGQEIGVTNILLSKTSLHDHKKLCSLDCPDIEECLRWISKIISNIIQDQTKEGIVEKVDEVCEQEITEGEKVFYLPHRPVIRESAEPTKIRIVYDASSKPTKNSACLNDYLETAPPLQNSMWDILVRSRFKPILLCGDIEKAFLQIRIRKCERNVLRFHWVKDCDRNHVEINRFTRLVFGLTQSPFILEATLKAHFHNYLMNYPKVIENISDDMYVDDLTSGGNTVGEVEILKQKCEELFKKGGFNLHKWHSYIPSLENTKTTTSSELTYAKQMFQTSSNETKILGVPWTN